MVAEVNSLERWEASKDGITFDPTDDITRNALPPWHDLELTKREEEARDRRLKSEDKKKRHAYFDRIAKRYGISEDDIEVEKEKIEDRLVMIQGVLHWMQN